MEPVEPEKEEARWPFFVILALLFALVVVLLLLIRTRGALASKVVKGATGFLKDVTRPLGAAPRRAPGKLIVQRGANVGREYALSEPVTKVGRDSQFSDFALQDEYISNPHFSIHREGTQFYIMDEAAPTARNSTGWSCLRASEFSPGCRDRAGRRGCNSSSLGLLTIFDSSLPLPPRQLRLPQPSIASTGPLAEPLVESVTPNPYDAKVQDDDVAYRIDVEPGALVSPYRIVRACKRRGA